VSLFGDDTGPEPARPASQPASADTVADWQVSQLRSALDATGLTAMEDRQALVVELLGRSVSSLRDLTSAEARQLAEGFAARKNAGTQRGSSWDDREEDTWIDRL